jgi:predicted metal-dependent phosphoesterase TrpH
LQIDIHVHTSPGSRCSSMSLAAYAAAIADMGLSCVCLTNHGDMNDYEAMLGMLPQNVILIPGVEISSHEGDFLIYSTDTGFLRTLLPLQDLPPASKLPEDTVVVWAHPFAGIPGGLALDDDHVRKVTPKVNGIEVLNGNWPDEDAALRAAEIAEMYDLAPMGGSDTHRSSQLFRCWTEVEQITTTADFIDAVRKSRTKPGSR